MGGDKRNLANGLFALFLDLCLLRIPRCLLSRVLLPLKPRHKSPVLGARSGHAAPLRVSISETQLRPCGDPADRLPNDDAADVFHLQIGRAFVIQEIPVRLARVVPEVAQHFALPVDRGVVGPRFAAESSPRPPRKLVRTSGVHADDARAFRDGFCGKQPESNGHTASPSGRFPVHAHRRSRTTQNELGPLFFGRRRLPSPPVCF